MARLKMSNEHPVTLFPMFNILIGTIGIFLLTISAVSTVSLGPGRSVSVHTQRALSGKHAKTPVFIEWDGKRITIHPGKRRVSLPVTGLSAGDGEMTGDSAGGDAGAPPGEGKTANQAGKSPLEDLLRQIYRERDKKYIVVMVRPSGFETFVSLRNFLLNRGIDVGYEPIDQNWNFEVR